MRQNMKKKRFDPTIDWTITLLPLGIIAVISVVLMLFPETAGSITGMLREVFVINWVSSILYWVWAFYLLQSDWHSPDMETSGLEIWKNPDTIILAGVQ